jgi:hypothetical protein
MTTPNPWPDIPGGVYVNGQPVTPDTFNATLDSAMAQANRTMGGGPVMDDVCVMCGVSIDATLSDDTAALYASSWSATIIGWSCSDACTDAWETKVWEAENP